VQATPVAVYVHTPFCPSKCGYCDFNSFALEGEIIGRTVEATIAEIRRTPWRGSPAKTIFFGGGTPTHLQARQLTSILDAVLEMHPPIAGAEITSEANPGTVDHAKLEAMRKAGFNRISFGAQSFLKEDLVRLGRIHRAGEVGRAVTMARETGFDNLNLDLMFALPGQRMKGWEQNLDLAIMLQPEHLSLYCLTIEPNTRFHKLHLRGMLDLPDDDLQVEMYDAAVRVADKAGYDLYEISNYAKPGSECRHNLCYWRCEEYLAYGPGGVGCYGYEEKRTRYTNMKHPLRYCDAIESGTRLWCDSEEVDEEMHSFEKLMLGLRLAEGIDVGHVPNAVNLAKLIDRGWCEQLDDRVRLTPAGRHFCNAAAVQLSQ
jgi:oxygen-independent coproporphyrinogen III oxidase